jgi:hypothetical protein
MEENVSKIKDYYHILEKLPKFNGQIKISWIGWEKLRIEWKNVLKI